MGTNDVLVSLLAWWMQSVHRAVETYDVNKAMQKK